MHLDTGTFAYSTIHQDMSQLLITPFQLIFGHQAILPVDIDLQKGSGDELHCKYQVLNDQDIVIV